MLITNIKPGTMIQGDEVFQVPRQLIIALPVHCAAMDLQKLLLFEKYCYGRLPPIHLLACPEGLVIQDGHHRFHAHLLWGTLYVDAKVEGVVPDFEELAKDPKNNGREFWSGPVPESYVLANRNHNHA